MSNPFFSSSPAFKETGPGSLTVTAPVPTTPAGYPGMPGYQPGQYGQQTAYGQAPQYGQQPAYGQHGQAPYGAQLPYGAPTAASQQAALEAQYAAPAATNVDRGRMTYDDVIVRTTAAFVVILVAASLTWGLATSSNPSLVAAGLGAVTVGSLGALVLGLVSSFKREPSPVLILTYCVLEGAMLGGLSGLMERALPGIVLQAVMASGTTFAVMLALYARAGFRLVGRARKVLLIAMGGYLVLAVINLALGYTGILTDPWGLYGTTIMGVPLGLLVSLAAVVMGALSLTTDFEAVQRGVERGLPTRYAWAGAFGLVVTLVWLYVEFLRVLSYLRED